jgi:hypothetical protein
MEILLEIFISIKPMKMERFVEQECSHPVREFGLLQQDTQTMGIGAQLHLG